MRVKKLKLVNWCNHADRVIEFGDLTSLRGPNGSGKTNTLNALVFAFTGKSRNEGTKDENKSSLAAKDAPCGVTVWFDHGGTSYELHRSVEPARQWLKYGDEKLTKAPQIRDYLKDVLGVDEKVMLDYVFVAQGKMDDFLSADDGDRAKAFSQLFGTEKAAKIWDVLQKPPIPDIKLNPEGPGASARLRVSEQAIAEARENLFTAEETLQDEEFDRADKTVQQAANAKRAREMLKVAELKCQATQGLIVKVEGDLATAVAARDALRDKLKALEEEYAAGEADQQALRVYNEWKLKVDRALSEKASVEKELADTLRSRPKMPENYVSAADAVAVDAELKENMASLLALNNLVKHCDGKTKCPVCLTTTMDGEVAERLAGAKAQIPELYELTKLLSESLRNSAAHDKDMSRWNDRMTSWQGQLNVAQAKIDTYKKMEPECPAATYNPTVLSRLQAARREAGPCSEAVATADKLLASLRGRLESEASHLTELSAHSVDEVPEERLIMAKELQEVRQQLQLQRTELKLVVQKESVEAIRLKAIAEEYAASRDKATALGELASHLDTVRGLFHREQLPMAVSQYYLTQIKDETNRILADLEVPFRPFWVESVNDLKFVVKFADDGSLCKAERLSGGQKVILALAFRLAVHFRFAGELGLLCLDEPTAGLDEDNMANLGVALGKLREVSKARGLQIVLITHERMLDNLCDRVVCLTDVP